MPYTTDTFTPAFSHTLPFCMTRVMPPPPPARTQASSRNLVPSISSMALQMLSCAARMTFSKRALVLRARQGRRIACAERCRHEHAKA